MQSQRILINMQKYRNSISFMDIIIYMYTTITLGKFLTPKLGSGPFWLDHNDTPVSRRELEVKNFNTQGSSH